MKTILFDFIAFEDTVINGGSLCTKTIFEKLIKKNCKIIGLSLDKNKINKDILQLVEKYNIEIVQMNNNLNEVVKTKNIDTLFIGIAQRFNKFDLSNLKCKIYILCHDIVDICLEKFNAYYDFSSYKAILDLCESKYSTLKTYKYLLKEYSSRFSLFLKRENNEKIIKKLNYQFFEKLISKENVFVLTVSEYSKNAIKYYFKNVANEIQVYYPPRIPRSTTKIIDINIDGPYFLLISTNRYTKNAVLFLNVFKKLNTLYNNKFKCVLVGAKKCDIENVICKPFVNDDELVALYYNCYAFIYPSLGEGFGYPPVEAMEFSKPVIASNDTSITEICGSSALLFNPFYEEDLFFKCNELINNYDMWCSKAKKRSEIINKKQEEDLEKIVELIMEL